MSVTVASRAEIVQPELPIPAQATGPPAPPAALALFAQARRGLTDAEREHDPAERFIASYLAALRAAAAVLAARGRPHRGRAKPASTWALLETAAPELKEWAVYFASNSAARASAQAGITRGMTIEVADDLLRQSRRFVAVAWQAMKGSG